MTQTTAGFANLGGRQTYCELQGQGEPLIMLHAAIADRHMWDEQWDELAKSFMVVRYDRPGFGQSPATENPLDSRQDLADLMDHLGLNRAHLLGCSMGGDLALDFALTYPERVCSLILVSATPGGFELQGEPPTGVFEMISAMQKGDLERANSLQIQISVLGPHRTAQVAPQLQERFLAMNLAALRNRAAMMPEGTPLTPPAIARLAEVQAPTLLMAGALDHPEILRAAWVMQAGIPNARQRVLPDTAHFPNVEQAAAFNRLVLEFLGGLNSRAGADR